MPATRRWLARWQRIEPVRDCALEQERIPAALPGGDCRYRRCSTGSIAIAARQAEPYLGRNGGSSLGSSPSALAHRRDAGDRRATIARLREAFSQRPTRQALRRLQERPWPNCDATVRLPGFRAARRPTGSRRALERLRSGAQARRLGEPRRRYAPREPSACIARDRMRPVAPKRVALRIVGWLRNNYRNRLTPSMAPGMVRYRRPGV